MRLAQLVFLVAWFGLAAVPPAMAADNAATIAFGDRGELIVNGNRHFILGGYRSGQQDTFDNALPSAAEAGFSMVHDYRFEGMNTGQAGGVQKYIDDARTYLRKADQLKLGVFLGLPRDAVTAANEDVLTQIVNQLSGEPALWFWYVFDEPNPSKVSPDAVSRVYQLLHRLDPKHPAVILSNRGDTG